MSSGIETFRSSEVVIKGSSVVAQQSSCSTLAFQPVGGRAFSYTAPDSASIMVGMSENLSSESRYASGVALVNVVAAGNEAGTVLDAWFPAPR